MAKQVKKNSKARAPKLVAKQRKVEPVVVASNAPKFQPRTLRPGLLVSLKTAIGGDNVKYNEIDRDQKRNGQEEHVRIETERTIYNVVEHERAKVVRGKCRSLIVAVCAATNFGYLCPEDKRDELYSAVQQARGLAEDFNGTATLSRIDVNVIVGRVAADDAEAVRAINGEVRALLFEMRAGVKEFDAKRIREAANKARQLGSMLTPDSQAKVAAAIETARAAARKIAKAGEQAAQVTDTFAIKRIDEQRTAFLDLDGDDGVAVVTPKAEGRAIDFAPAA